jgi:hypothetical protein
MPKQHLHPLQLLLDPPLFMEVQLTHQIQRDGHGDKSQRRQQ